MESGTDVGSDLGGTERSLTVTSLDPQTTYSFRIKAEILDQSSGWSDVVEVTTDAVPPPPPSGVFAVAQELGKNRVSWSGPTDGSTFEVFRSNLEDPDVFLSIGMTSDLTYLDEDIVFGGRYAYRVRSIRNGLNSSFSSTRYVNALGLTQPQLNLLTVDFQSATINWTGSDLSEDGGLVYLLERSLDGEIWEERDRILTRSYTDEPLLSETTYFYRVRITGEPGSSSPSGVLTVTTPAKPVPENPHSPVVTPGEGLRMLVSWQHIELATHYRVERQGDEGEPWMEVADVPADTLQIEDLDVIPGYRYTYRVVPRNEVGEGVAYFFGSAVAGHYVCIGPFDFESPLPADSLIEVLGATRRDLSEEGEEPNFGLLFDGEGLRQLRFGLFESFSTEQVVLTGRFRADLPVPDGPESDVWEPLEGSDETPLAGFEHSYRQYPLPVEGSWVPFSVVTSRVPGYWPLPGTDFGTIFAQYAHDGPGLDTWSIDDLCILIPVTPLPSRVPFVSLQSNPGANVILSWPQSSGAYFYRVERSADARHWDVLADDWQGDWFVDEGLLPGARYLYRVVAPEPFRRGGSIPVGGADSCRAASNRLWWREPHFAGGFRAEGCRRVELPAQVCLRIAHRQPWGRARGHSFPTRTRLTALP